MGLDEEDDTPSELDVEAATQAMSGLLFSQPFVDAILGNSVSGEAVDGRIETLILVPIGL